MTFGTVEMKEFMKAYRLCWSFFFTKNYALATVVIIGKINNQASENHGICNNTVTKRKKKKNKGKNWKNHKTTRR